MILEGMLIFGLAIMISVLGHILFEQTGIPESIFMIVLGVFAGPISGIISPSGLDPILPYMFRLSLLVIIFESGIHTRVSEAFTAIKKILAFHDHSINRLDAYLWRDITLSTWMETFS